MTISKIIRALAEVTFLTRGSNRLMQLKQLQLRFSHAGQKHFLLALGKPSLPYYTLGGVESSKSQSSKNLV